MGAAPVNALLGQLATVLNRNVAQSTRATSLAAQLDGRVLALALEGTPVTLYLKVGDGRIAIDTRHDGVADARRARGIPRIGRPPARGGRPARSTARTPRVATNGRPEVIFCAKRSDPLPAIR